MAAPSSRPLLSHRLTNPHHKPLPHLYSHHLLFRPFLPYLSTASTSNNNRSNYYYYSPINCRISSENGDVSDEFLSTSSFYREFSVIANMLKQIEPLDTSVISKGVSDSVKESMNRMISSMLGLLPSDQFSVRISVSKRPLVRLLASSVITGYTLWNAEYRVMLMRNFETSKKRLNPSDCNDATKDESEEECCSEELERLNLQSCLGDLSSDAMDYIQELELELSTAKKDLHDQKQETTRIEHARENNNDILKYLRSLDPDMLDELSRPSSSEVKRILQQLVQCASRRVFKEDITSSFMGDSEVVQENHKNGDVNFCETRDHLAKLLFWCMLLGHQLRGLENRLYLRCAVGFI